MACPQEDNNEEKVKEKLNKHHQLASKQGKEGVGYRVEVVPLVFGCFGEELGNCRRMSKKSSKLKSGLNE